VWTSETTTWVENGSQTRAWKFAGVRVAEELAVVADKAIADDPDAFCGYLPELAPRVHRISEIDDELQTLDSAQPTAAMLKRRDDAVAGLKRFEKDCEAQS
jgi:hypothetical protein